MEAILIALFAIIVFVVVVSVLLVYNTVAWGLVLYKFWGWFVLPVFTDLPDLTFVQALGLMFVVGLFRTQVGSHEIKDEYKKNKNAQTYAVLIAPWISLFIGWLAYLIFLG